MARAALPVTVIDRASPEPFYLQLTRFIEESIDKGVFAAGDRLPGESELCRRYDLARSTVRETMRTLEERRRIRVVPRRGAFVIDPDQSAWVLQAAEGFFEIEADQNRRAVETKVLDAKLKTLPEAAAQALQVQHGSTGFVLRRLRKLDGKLALYAINYLPPDLENVIAGSAAVSAGGSLNQALREAGYRITGARRSVEAVAASPELAKLLKVPAASPLLLVTSVSWGRDGRIFDYHTSWVRSDAVKIIIEASAAGFTR